MFYSSFKPGIAHFIGVSLICLMSLVGSGCGGDSPVDEGQTFEGPFIQITGAQSRTFDLMSGDLSVVCKPKLGLKEFDFEAADQPGAEGGTYLRFTIGDYHGPGDYTLEYEAAKPLHTVEVGLTADAGEVFKYRLFQELRLDNNELYSSYCNLHLNAEELQTKTRYAGLINCIMLWADFDSSDSDNGNLTSYIDIVSKFECEY